MSSPSAILLPKYYRPEHYDVNLSISFAQSTFEGTVEIHLVAGDAAERTADCVVPFDVANDVFAVHCVGLRVCSARFNAVRAKTVIEVDGSDVKMDEKMQAALISLKGFDLKAYCEAQFRAQQEAQNEKPIVIAKIRIKFNGGSLDGSLKGLYRSEYIKSNGQKTVMGKTFETYLNVNNNNNNY